MPIQPCLLEKKLAINDIVHYSNHFSTVFINVTASMPRIEAVKGI
jgi:hypothetical protein